MERRIKALTPGRYKLPTACTLSLENLSTLHICSLQYFAVRNKIFKSHIERCIELCFRYWISYNYELKNLFLMLGEFI